MENCQAPKWQICCLLQVNTVPHLSHTVHLQVVGEKQNMCAVGTKPVVNLHSRAGKWDWGRGEGFSKRWLIAPHQMSHHLAPTSSPYILVLPAPGSVWLCTDVFMLIADALRINLAFLLSCLATLTTCEIWGQIHISLSSLSPSTKTDTRSEIENSCVQICAASVLQRRLARWAQTVWKHLFKHHLSPQVPILWSLDICNFLLFCSHTSTTDGGRDVLTRGKICRVAVHHSGQYQCRPSNSPPANVSLVVLEGDFYQTSTSLLCLCVPHELSQLLVAAFVQVSLDFLQTNPTQENFTLQCSPRHLTTSSSLPFSSSLSSYLTGLLPF